MTYEELQEIEDMLDGEFSIPDDEILHWLRIDSCKMLQEIRRLQKELEAKSENNNDQVIM